MGTSSARRGPTGPFWRLAKRAASRYLSPGTAGRMSAREVAARYVAALGEGGVPPDLAGALAAFRLTRRVAQNLGAFCCQAASRGWPATLDAWGLKAAAGEEVIAVPGPLPERRPGDPGRRTGAGGGPYGPGGALAPAAPRRPRRRGFRPCPSPGPGGGPAGAAIFGGRLLSAPAPGPGGIPGSCGRGLLPPQARLNRD